MDTVGRVDRVDERLLPIGRGVSPGNGMRASGSIKPLYYSALQGICPASTMLINAESSLSRGRKIRPRRREDS